MNNNINDGDRNSHPDNIVLNFTLSLQSAQKSLVTQNVSAAT
ncbi:hypothetical protein ACQFX9_13655 [Aliinostoc sp. HNIBRCY26]